MLLHQPIDFQANRRPSNPALSAHDYVWDYATLVQHSHDVARLLIDHGIQPGDRIGVLGLNSAAHLAIFIGASRVGAVAVSVNFRLAPVELAFILDDAGVSLLFVTDSSIAETVTSMTSHRQGDTAIIGHHPGATITFDALFHGGAAPYNRDVNVDENDPVMQLYTSGTTGKPKGAVLSHRNLVSLLTMMTLGNDGQYTSKNTDLIIAPLFHIGGAGIAYIALATGGHGILHEAFDPVRVVETIQEEQVNTLFMVPAMIQAICKLVPNVEQYDLSSLEHIAYGAAPISVPLLKEALGLFKCRLSQVYGMTETAGTVISLPPEAHDRALAGEEHLLRSCGKATAGNEVKIVDEDGGMLGPNQTGEICLRSASNMRHYFNRPEATEKTLIDGWVHTGDAGFVDEQGYVFLRDRIKDMVVSGGENIYPVEVENILAGLPGVIEVAVIGIPDERFGEALLAIFALKPGVELDLDMLLEFCREKLAGYKIPRQIAFVDALPRNPSGKILKTTLREPYWTGHDRRIG